jgi:hypothetical protein
MIEDLAGGFKAFEAAGQKLTDAMADLARAIRRVGLRTEDRTLLAWINRRLELESTVIARWTGNGPTKGLPHYAWLETQLLRRIKDGYGEIAYDFLADVGPKRRSLQLGAHRALVELHSVSTTRLVNNDGVGTFQWACRGCGEARVGKPGCTTLRIIAAMWTGEDGFQDDWLL